MTNKSESTVTYKEVSFFFRLSILWGVCFLPLAHAFLQQLASLLGWDPFDFNTVPLWASVRVGLIGGAFTSPLVLGGTYFSIDPLDLESSEVLIFLAGPMIVIGGIQGGIGSMVLYGRSFVVDGQEIPDVLGTSGASIIGYLGGFFAFVVVMIFLALRRRFLRLTLCKRCAASHDSGSTCRSNKIACGSSAHQSPQSRS